MRMPGPTRAVRAAVAVPADFVGGGISGSGRLRNLSISGARIEGSEHRPEIGTPLVVQLFPLPGVMPLHVFAEVVRETETGGFAVRFRSSEAKRRMLRLMTLSSPVLAPKHG
jgi:hypothetical protein